MWYVKLSLYSACLYMKPTLLIWARAMCRACYKLSQCTHGVSEKFKYFVSFLRQNCITNKRDAANPLHKIYDKNSIIECKLIVYDLDIVYTALHDIINKCMLKYIFFSSKIISFLVSSLLLLYIFVIVLN